MAKRPKPERPAPVVRLAFAARDECAVYAEDPMAFLVRIYPGAYPPTPREIAFQWVTQASATSYVLRVGTASGLADVFHQNVGYVLTYPLTLTPRHYWVNVIPMIGTAPQTPLGEQEVTV